VSAFIDEHRERFGVEPICSTPGVSVSAYYERASGRQSEREVEDERLLARITEVHDANYCASMATGVPGRRSSVRARTSAAIVCGA
jgi:putative transposase